MNPNPDTETHQMTQPIYTVTRGRIAYSVTAAFGNMRKPSSWVIYPITDPENVKIQCDNRIAQVNLLTGRGVLSARIPNGAYNVHLLPSLGATDYQFPAAFCEALMESPVSGQFAKLSSTQAQYLQEVTA
jgi:hypothetical protein